MTERSTAVWVDDPIALGRRLMSLTTDGQSGVAVLVTLRARQVRPDFDADRIAGELGPAASVLVVPHELAPQVERSLGDEFAVFNGAARVFPVRRPGRPYVAKLYLCDDLERNTGRLLREARLALQDAARPAAPASVAPPAPATQARVSVRDGVHHIGTPGLAHDLGRYLLDPGRPVPVVVVTRQVGQAVAYVSGARIAEAVGDRAEVFEMPTGAVTWAFEDALAAAPGTGVFGGASRVYPTGLDWASAPHLSPLRFVYEASEGGRVTDVLISDALAAAFRGGHSTTVPDQRTVAGEVTMVVSGRGLVRLEDGSMAAVWPELTVPDVPVERLVETGMRVEGALDEEAGRLDVTGSLRSSAEALEGYRAGSYVLGRVRALEPSLAILELYPDVEAALEPTQIFDDEEVTDVRDWLTLGEVVVARVVRRGDNDDDWELTLVDVDPAAEAAPAPALLPDGPAWLVAPRRARRLVAGASERPAVVAEQPKTPPVQPDTVAEGPEVLAEQPEIAAEPPSPATEPDHDQTEEAASDLSLMVADLEQERSALAARLRRLDDDVERLRMQNTRFKQAAREAQAELSRVRKQQGQAGDALADRDADLRAFADPERQFRWEVELEYARRIPAAEKRELALGEYRILPGFLDTLGVLEARDRIKAVEVVVDIATGRVHAMNSRATHQLRTGPGGDDAYLVREDGAACWRVSLQHKTPSARRIHYWMPPDGVPELSSVRVHDDIRP